LQCAFPLDILMVPSSTITVAADAECLSSNGFYLGETIHFGSLKFITDCFGSLNLSPRKDGLDAAAMGSTHSGPLSRLWDMTRDSIKEFHMASDGEGGLGLPSARTHGMGASPTPATAKLWSENTPTTEVMTTTPLRLVAPPLGTDLPFERWCPHQEGKQENPTLSQPALSRRQCNDRMR
jgi:hypothetical protein